MGNLFPHFLGVAPDLGVFFLAFASGLRADNDRLRSAAYPSSNANSGFAPSQPTQQATTAQLPTVAVVDDEESVRFLRDENRRLRGELEDLQKSLAEMELKANVTANVSAMLVVVSRSIGPLTPGTWYRTPNPPKPLLGSFNKSCKERVPHSMTFKCAWAVPSRRGPTL